ncbi:hypothetical protein pb186bvf_012464 [Paramecium bursaria]
MSIKSDQQKILYRQSPVPLYFIQNGIALPQFVGEQNRNQNDQQITPMQLYTIEFHKVFGQNPSLNALNSQQQLQAYLVPYQFAEEQEKKQPKVIVKIEDDDQPSGFIKSEIPTVKEVQKQNFPPQKQDVWRIEDQYNLNYPGELKNVYKNIGRALRAYVLKEFPTIDQQKYMEVRELIQRKRIQGKYDLKKFVKTKMGQLIWQQFIQNYRYVYHLLKINKINISLYLRQHKLFLSMR